MLSSQFARNSLKELFCKHTDCQRIILVVWVLKKLQWIICQFVTRKIFVSKTTFMFHFKYGSCSIRSNDKLLLCFSVDSQKRCHIGTEPLRNRFKKHDRQVDLSYLNRTSFDYNITTTSHHLRNEERQVTIIVTKSRQISYSETPLSPPLVIPRF